MIRIALNILTGDPTILVNEKIDIPLLAALRTIKTLTYDRVRNVILIFTFDCEWGNFKMRIFKKRYHETLKNFSHAVG